MSNNYKFETLGAAVFVTYTRAILLRDTGASISLFVATGFNKWGMTSSMVAAMLLADLVQGKDNRFAKLFSPPDRYCIHNWRSILLSRQSGF